MGEVLLTAGTNPLFVANATGTASTSVKYDSMYPIHLWRRLDGGAWTEENLVGSARSAAEAADLEKRGKRTTPTMGPGQFVEYGALFEGVDPNTKGFRDSAFRGYLMIDVLLNPTTLATPGPDTGLFPGGTFVRQRLATTEPARYAVPGWKTAAGCRLERISAATRRQSRKILDLRPAPRRRSCSVGSRDGLPSINAAGHAARRLAGHSSCVQNETTQGDRPVQELRRSQRQ